MKLPCSFVRCCGSLSTCEADAFLSVNTDNVFEGMSGASGHVIPG